MPTDPRDMIVLLDAPVESLEVEFKDWLSLEDNAHCACLAKAIIALANHGGGLLVVGFFQNNGTLIPSNTPSNAEEFTIDSVSAVISKYLEPEISVRVERNRNSQGYEAVAIIVPGGHTVPIRSKRGGPQNVDLLSNTYYVRRPGPKSEPPQTAHEWDTLIRRCVINSRDALLRDISHVLSATGAEAKHTTTHGERFQIWLESAEGRLKGLYSESPDAFRRGYWRVGYSITGGEVQLSLQEWRSVLEASQMKLTGWPAWIFLRPPELSPYPINDLIECHVSDGDPKRAQFTSHSDFWRASRDPFLVLFRGYREDAESETPVIDYDVPVWSIGEAVLHAQRLANFLGREREDVLFSVRWTGIAGRTLTSLRDTRFLPFKRVSRQDEVLSMEAANVVDITTQAAAVVHRLVAPLYTAFDFAEISLSSVERIMARLQGKADS